MGFLAIIIIIAAAFISSLNHLTLAQQNIPTPLVTFDPTWVSESFSFVGSIQQVLNATEEERSFGYAAHDNDNDGIWVVDNVFLPAGDYDVAVLNLNSHQIYGLHGTLGSLGGGDGSATMLNFTVDDGDASAINFYFDWRDLVFEASTNMMLVVCGNFMADAGYYSTVMGSESANWNPNNLLGWLKKDVYGNGVYTTFLHVPVGTWHYKICFHGEPLETSVGFGGSQFPFVLDVTSAGGADVVFTYDSLTHMVSDSLNIAMPLLLVSPMLAAPLGDRALSPYLPSERGAWVGSPLSFLGSFGPSMDTPEVAWDVTPFIRVDMDGDGITELQLRLLPGGYQFFAMSFGAVMVAYNRLGEEMSMDPELMKLISFSVPQPPADDGGDGYTDVSLFFDWGDKVAGASTNVMPVVCGDFMEPAGYFSGADEEAAAGANWNPSNLLGWMKKYDDESDVYRLFLHVPQGLWEYKICFQGEPLETSVGFGGSQFPFVLDVTYAGGADVVFTYDSLTHMVSDSLNVAMPLLLMSPMLVAPLGDRALSPYLPSERGAWVGSPLSFLGSFGPSMDAPEGAWDVMPFIRVDMDGDGITELQLRLLPGGYQFFAMSFGAVMVAYNRLGEEMSLDPALMKLVSFSVPQPAADDGGDGYTDVSLFFDWGDKVAGASTHVMPVVCGDFMGPAGYFSGADEELAAGANWNPSNLFGWMKKYADDSNVYQIFLHVPQGSWSYKIGFYGSTLVTHSVGFGGSVFPVHLEVSAASGADVTFMYDGETGTIQDSINGQLSSFSTHSAAPLALGAHVLSPYYSPSNSSAWAAGAASVAFPGNYGPSRVTPQAKYDPTSSLASDDDGDGIIELSLSLTAGSYQFVVEDQADLEVYDVLGAAVSTGGGYEGVASPRVFDVVVGGSGERADVSLYVDLRDFAYEASTNVMPVLCGDFMAAAGYHGGAVDEASANWNPDNLMGWMKNYDGEGSLHQIYLHIPEGQWQYMICFRGMSMEERSIGFGGSSSSSSSSIPFPTTLVVPTGGRDVSFVYDSKWGIVGDSQNGLPLRTCSKDCGFHGSCLAEMCECDPGYVGEVCELKTHFSSVFMKEVNVTVNGTLAYSDGPPVQVPISGAVTCADLILTEDGSFQCTTAAQPVNADTPTKTVNGTVMTKLVDGKEVPVYVDGPPVIFQTLVVDESGGNCGNIIEKKCEFHCEPGWTGKFCTLRDHCIHTAGAGGGCEGGCETGWGGEGCMQRSPMGGGSGYGMDLGGRIYPWALPPVGPRDKPTWHGSMSADTGEYATEWMCSQGEPPVASLRTMETWVYMHPFSLQFEPTVMPLLSLGVFQWGLKLFGPGVFQPHLMFGDPFRPNDGLNTGLGINLKRGAFPLYTAAVNSWVHVAMVLTPDEEDGGNFIVSSFINGELQFSSSSNLATFEVTGDSMLIGAFHPLRTNSMDSSHQQWVRALFDEFRLWSKPQSALDIKDRLYRPLTEGELAWPDKTEYPECIFYLPFVPENFAPGDVIGATPGGYFLRIKSIAGSGDNLIFHRVGAGATTESAYTSDVTAVVPSAAPIAGFEHIVVGDAGTPILFRLPSMAAEVTRVDALSYPPLVPLVPGGVGGTGVPAAAAAEATVIVTSVEWQKGWLFSEGTVAPVQTGPKHVGVVTLVVDGGGESPPQHLKAGMNFSALSLLNVTLAPGDWSTIMAPILRSGGERVQPVLRIGYTTTLAGLTSPEAFAVVHVTPPSTPVVGPSGKALRCNGAGPLGSLAADFLEYRQWAVADVAVDFTEGGADSSEGVTLELWFLLENLEGPDNLERLVNRFVASLGAGEDSWGLRYVVGAQMSTTLPRGQVEFFRAQNCDTPVRAWTHMAIHLYPSSSTVVTVYINGDPYLFGLRVDIPFTLYKGLFLCGGPAFGFDDDGERGPGFEGGIDEVRLWRGKRSLEEIKSWMFRRLHHGLLSEEEQGRLMGYWDFEDDSVVPGLDAEGGGGGSGGRILDRSGNGHDLIPGGCHVATDVPNPPACEGRTDVAPNPNHIPTTYYPEPESPVTDGSLSQVEAEMGGHPVVLLEGYDPVVMRCPVTTSTECRDKDLARAPRISLDEFPPAEGVGGASLWVIEVGDAGGEGVELTHPDTWSTSSNDVIRVKPVDPMAGGRPFVTLAYHLTSPVSGLVSDVKRVDVNIRCGTGHWLDQEASQCVLCPVGSYLQTPSYESECCDLNSPGEGCFRCDPGFAMVMGEGVAPAGMVACERIPCGQYETAVLLENGLQECVPSFDLPPSLRDFMMGATGVVFLFVLGIVAFVFKFRKTRVIVNSSRSFLALMLIGLLLMTAAVGVLLQSPTPQLCGLKTGLFHVGFSLMFSSAVAKTWRLHKIFNNKKMVHLRLKMSRLYQIVAAFVGVDVVVVALWLVVAPFEVPNEMQKVCESDLMGIFLGLLLLSKAVLMATGCWLAYQVRGVPSSFNESAGIALTLNNVTLMAVVVLGVTGAMEDQLNEGGVTKILQATGGLVGVLAPLVFIFLPKFRLALTNKKQQQTKARKGTGTSTFSGVSSKGSEDGEFPEATVNKVEKLKNLEIAIMQGRTAVATINTSLKKLEEEVAKAKKKLARDEDELDYMRAEDPKLRNVVFKPEELTAAGGPDASTPRGPRHSVVVPSSKVGGGGSSAAPTNSSG